MRKDFFKRISYFIGLFFIVLPLTTYAAEDTYIIENKEVFRIKSDGSKNKISDVEILGEKDEDGENSGDIRWILVDPENSSEMEGSKEGIYFFDKNDKFISFIPHEDAAHCMIKFDPQMNNVMIFGGSGIIADCEFYDFKTSKLKGSFIVFSPSYFWIDNNHILLQIFDKNKKNPRYEDIYLSSIVIYDISKEKIRTLITDTETSDYFLENFDSERGELEIIEEYVIDVEDWQDEDKIRKRSIKITLENIPKEKEIQTFTKEEISKRMNLSFQELEDNFYYAFEAKYVSEDYERDFTLDEFYDDEINYSRPVFTDKINGYFDNDYFYFDSFGKIYVITKSYIETIEKNLKNPDKVLAFALEVDAQESVIKKAKHYFEHKTNDEIISIFKKNENIEISKDDTLLNKVVLFYMMDNDISFELFEGTQGTEDAEDSDDLNEMVFNVDKTLDKYNLNKGDLVIVKTFLPDWDGILKAEINKKESKQNFVFIGAVNGEPSINFFLK